MSHKKKGQLVVDIEWHKHLRKFGKKFFWSRERNAEKKLFAEEVSNISTIH